MEFGPKLSASLVNGYVHVDRISWDAYNESVDLVEQVERYKRRFGYYPEVVITDQIYGTRENRKYLKERGIRYSGRPLGRPPAENEAHAAETRAEKKRRKQEARLRAWMEGCFGVGKSSYGLDSVKTRTKITSETYIVAAFFAMNLVRGLKALLFARIYSVLRRLWAPYREFIGPGGWIMHPGTGTWPETAGRGSGCPPESQYKGETFSADPN